MKSENILEYGALYDSYWSRADRIGESSGDMEEIAELVAATCGFGSVLDVGCGEGVLVSRLLGRGIDAFGYDVSTVVLKRAGQYWPERFFHGSALSMPFAEDQFDTVVSTDCLEHLAPADIPKALREMRRVAAKYVFLQIATTQDRDAHWHLTVEGRAWWEARCFEAGLRKHPLYYRANPYESLNQDEATILILLEKVPAPALESYDLTVLAEERLLHTDMLRETGRRSDAHCIRYHRASEFIRPGDRVLDVACGLGYGSHILYHASPAQSVIGVDLSDFAVAYAQAHYGQADRIDFRVGDAQALSAIADHSIDFITAFETIEHVPEPETYLRELRRVLKPAGRLMVCAPNDWSDETGKDPNPHHLHVYTWTRLRDECARHFLIERSFLQTAGGARKCHHSPRSWQEVPTEQLPEQEAEWVLMLCMADPLQGQGIEYQETAWRLPDAPGFHVSAFRRDYDNPWLVKGMVAIGMRSQSPQLLERMRRKVMAAATNDSVDYGAALCGRVYSALEQTPLPGNVYEKILRDIHRYAGISNPSPHQLRWQVSLLFAGGELARRHGRFDEAVALYSRCADHDVTVYSPLLGNRILDALHWLAAIAISRHQREEARRWLLACVAEAQRFAAADWLNVTGDPEAPLPFGLAEMSQLLDKASRAAYMLEMIERGGRNGLLYQEARGFFERRLCEKNNRLITLERNVTALSSELASQESVKDSLVEQIVKMDSEAQGLARQVAERDRHAQRLAQEVRRLDGHAQKLAEEVRRHDACAQQLAVDFSAREERIRELTSALSEEQTQVQGLQHQMAKKESRLHELVCELENQQAQGRRLVGELEQSQQTLGELTRMVKRQNFLLLPFRPWHWPRVLKKLIRGGRRG